MLMAFTNAQKDRPCGVLRLPTNHKLVRYRRQHLLFKTPSTAKTTPVTVQT